MPGAGPVLSREVKLAAVRRMLAGERLSALAGELKIRTELLYRWRARFQAGGAEALHGRRGRPPKSAWVVPSRGSVDDLAASRLRVAELERKIGQQQLELDFFRQALRQVAGQRQPTDGLGATASTRSSKR